MESNKKTNRAALIVIRIIVCLIVLAVGVMGMGKLASMRKPPAEVEFKETPIKARIQEAELEDAKIFITGSGQARARDSVSLAPEVGGGVVSVHSDLEAGRIIGKGDVLFSIDQINYRAAYNVAAATVSQVESSIARLEKQYSVDVERQKTLNRNREIAQAEYVRMRSLFENSKVGAQSGVDRAESAFNSASDSADQIAMAVDLYPIRIKEAKSNLKASRARLTAAKADLDRTVIRAPFSGRVVKASIEKGQFVQPGVPVITLADDSMLEIQVSIDSRDARDWLLFGEPNGNTDSAWFGHLEPVVCEIRWTEDNMGHAWEGILNRVVQFNSNTRTLTLAIQIPGKTAFSKDQDRLPLVEGMFCNVSIPGKELKGVVRLPRWAVSFENTVYVSREGRLKTVSVTTARVQGEEAFISHGIEPGDQVIVTRLSDPLENSIVEKVN